MLANWDSMDLLGWGLVVVLVLLAAALVTYLARAWGAAGRRREAERAELGELRRRVDRDNS